MQRIVGRAASRRVAWTVICATTIGIPGTTGYGREPAPPRVAPPDVFVRVALLRDELELIRLETGQLRNRQPEIAIRNAAPREAYFQALTLFRKSDRLCFERIRQTAPEPAAPRHALDAADVLRVVNLSLDRIRLVKADLGITETCTAQAADQSRTTTDVFRSVVQANRQLNLMLQRRFAPSDVFQQVTLSVNYSARLLGAFPGSVRIGSEPPLVRRKRPGDVYKRLLECFETLRRTAQQSGVEMLALDPTGEVEEVTPSDVYDIASLLVSELAYLDSLLDDASPAFEPYDPGPMLPAHVFQRAGILHGQLLELQQHVGRNPDWLGGRH